MTETLNREAFEKWASKKEGADFTRHEDSGYERHDVHVAWEAWQAASRSEILGDKHEKDMLQVIDERDAAQEALSQAYYLITGSSPEWSNHFGYAEALEEIDDAQRLLRVSIPKRESVNQEARELIEILHGAMLGLQSMSNETAKARFDEYINLSGEFLLRNSIEVQETE